MSREELLHSQLAVDLYNMFKKDNIHAQSYMMMEKEVALQHNSSDETNRIPELRMAFTVKDNLDQKRCNVQKSNEVTAIFTTNADGEIPESWVTVRIISNLQLRNISMSNKHVDAWLYLIFSR